MTKKKYMKNIKRHRDTKSNSASPRQGASLAGLGRRRRRSCCARRHQKPSIIAIMIRDEWHDLESSSTLTARAHLLYAEKAGARSLDELIQQCSELQEPG